jgi:hypothetical protein
MGSQIKHLALSVFTQLQEPCSESQHLHAMTWLGHPDSLSHACILYLHCRRCLINSKSGSGRSRTAADEAQASPSFTPENPVTPRWVGFGRQGQ